MTGGMTPAEWVGVIGAPIGAATGVIAWLGLRTSAGTRRDQAEAEARRRHREMRPILEVTVSTRNGPDLGLLVVKLVGPREVERYDWIRVEVRNDKDRLFPGPTRDRSEEEWRRQVWGPFRLRPRTDGADEIGRTACQDGRAVTDSWLFTVERSTPPRWYGGGDAEWRKDYAGTPIRLRIEVGLDDRSWVELVEVSTPRQVSRKGRSVG